MSVAVDTIDRFFEMLDRHEPFSLARFNDGEMAAIMGSAKRIARGQQQVTPELRVSLRRALLARQHNYWVGIPCSTCWPEHHKKAKHLIDHSVGDPAPNITSAVVMTNRNLARVRRDLPLVLKGRKVGWIGSELHETKKLPFIVKYHSRVPDMNAWDAYNQILSHPFSRDEVVFLSCGPLASVLACEFFEMHPYATFIDIGSVFDPETIMRHLRVHEGTLPRCKECN